MSPSDASPVLIGRAGAREPPSANRRGRRDEAWKLCDRNERSPLASASRSTPTTSHDRIVGACIEIINVNDHRLIFKDETVTINVNYTGPVSLPLPLVGPSPVRAGGRAGCRRKPRWCYEPSTRSETEWRVPAGPTLKKGTRHLAVRTGREVSDWKPSTGHGAANRHGNRGITGGPPVRLRPNRGLQQPKMGPTRGDAGETRDNALLLLFGLVQRQ
jgi:hypothetical protein